MKLALALSFGIVEAAARSSDSSSLSSSSSSSNLLGYQVWLPKVPFSRAHKLCQSHGQDLAKYDPKLTSLLFRAMRYGKVDAVWMDSSSPVNKATLINRPTRETRDYTASFIARHSANLHKRYAVVCKVGRQLSPHSTSSSSSSSTSSSSSSSSSEEKRHKPAPKRKETKRSKKTVKKGKDRKGRGQEKVKKPSRRQKAVTQSVSGSQETSSVSKRSKHRPLARALKEYKTATPTVLASESKHPHYKIRINGAYVDSNSRPARRIIQELRRMPIGTKQDGSLAPKMIATR